MKIINLILEKLIKTTYAQSIPNDIGPMCYAVGPIPTEEQFILVIQNSTMFKIITFILAPLSAILLSIRSAINLLRRPAFSVLYSIYKAFLRVIILSFIFFFFIFLYLYFAFNLGFSLNSILVAFGLQFLIICVSTGLGYIIFSFKSKKFLGLGLAYIFVIPCLLISFIFFVLDIIPAFNKYLPQDVISFKKEQLKKRLIKEGKIPEDNGSNL